MTLSYFFFFFNDTATTEIYTLSLHDALPICAGLPTVVCGPGSIDQAHKPDEYIAASQLSVCVAFMKGVAEDRSEEHTSELQSHLNIVCRLLLEKHKHRHALHQVTQIE